jgi:hypothetical protein
MKKPNLRDDTENLNPFSSKGVLTFSSFLAIFLGTALFNLLTFVLLKAQLISARASLEVEKGLLLYGLWFVFSLLGFMSVTNAFIKRWAHIFDERELGGVWKSLIRLALLSPVLGLPITVLTLIYFPKSPILDVHGGAPKMAIKASLLFSLLIGFCAPIILPRSLFGLERVQFRESMKGVVEVLTPDGKNPIPSDDAIRPVFAVASPGVRYLGWLVADFLRTRALSTAIASSAKTLCDQRLGFMEVEVNDCFFYRLRQISTKTPMVSPYFALFYETDYRKRKSEDFHDNLTSLIADLKQQVATATPGAELIVERRAKDMSVQSAMSGFANALLMLSNQLELVEVGPMFIDRKELAKPAYLLRVFGSPELPFIELGQDAQRYSLISKLLPVFEFQLESIEAQAKKTAARLGDGGVVLEATLHETRNRITAIRRDPLAIGSR